jgi:hypothetical protein
MLRLIENFDHCNIRPHDIDMVPVPLNIVAAESGPGTKLVMAAVRSHANQTLQTALSDTMRTGAPARARSANQIGRATRTAGCRQNALGDRLELSVKSIRIDGLGQSLSQVHRRGVGNLSYLITDDEQKRAPFRIVLVPASAPQNQLEQILRRLLANFDLRADPTCKPCFEKRRRLDRNLHRLRRPSRIAVSTACFRRWGHSGSGCGVSVEPGKLRKV